LGKKERKKKAEKMSEKKESGVSKKQINIR
jgi:hypothetical protein